MADTNRRDALKIAAGLAVAAAAAPATGQEPAAPPPTDPALVRARANPEAFMLGDPVTFRIEGDGASRDLVITPALDESGRPAAVHLRSSSVRVFRADAGVDEFTRGGGLYWRFHEASGRVRLPAAGGLVMAVREGYHTVRLYTMELDFRC